MATLRCLDDDLVDHSWQMDRCHIAKNPQPTAPYLDIILTLLADVSGNLSDGPVLLSRKASPWKACPLATINTVKGADECVPGLHLSSAEIVNLGSFLGM